MAPLQDVRLRLVPQHCSSWFGTRRHLPEFQQLVLCTRRCGGQVCSGVITLLHGFALRASWRPSACLSQVRFLGHARPFDPWETFLRQLLIRQSHTLGSHGWTLILSTSSYFHVSSNGFGRTFLVLTTFAIFQTNHVLVGGKPHSLRPPFHH